MKHVRLSLSLLLLAAVLSTEYFQSAAAEDLALKGVHGCNCMTPNTGRYGEVIDGECLVSDCYIDVSLNE